METGIDPGAKIINPAAAELAYQDLMEAWLSVRFGRDRGAEGLGRIPPITVAGGEEVGNENGKMPPRRVD